MRILVIGGGGREHAIAWKLAQSPQVARVFVAPGNGGTAMETKCTNVPIAASDILGLLAFAMDSRVDITVVGPEEPLVLGVVDAFRESGHRIFGPTRSAARLEGSKAWAKALMERCAIPTAVHATFSDYYDALAHVMAVSEPPVVKVSGLAAGKGVFVPDCFDDAERALRDVFIDKKFGDAPEVVIEEKLSGPEISVLAFCDGARFRVMPIAQDHKRLHEGDVGPNTGGMGAYAPVPAAVLGLQDWQDTLSEIGDRVFSRVLSEMVRLDCPYSGVLYAGLIVTDAGIKVLEFNCRFGDPETQVILPLLDSDLAEILNACVDGRLDSIEPIWSDAAAATVVMAAAGYPGPYASGDTIKGLDRTAAVPSVTVFHAGTALRDRQIVTTGGRVLAVTGTGATLADALATAYEGINLIEFEGSMYRRDIGSGAVPNV